MLNVVVLAVGAYAALIGALYAFQRNLLYLPDRTAPSLAASGFADARAVTLRTADGLALAAWYRPAPPERPTIVYFHGNAGHIGHRIVKARPYIEAGYGVLLVEYRGYGGNPGKPTEEGLIADGRAAIDFLAADARPSSRLVLYGESLGGGVAAWLAAEMADRGQPVAAVVLEGAFTSVTDVAAVHYPWAPVRWLTKDRFDSLPRISRIRAPLLMVHGGADDIVPIEIAMRLFEAAADPKEAKWLQGGDHNNLHAHGLDRLVLDFLGRHLVAH